jgi:hypothetical protein
MTALPVRNFDYQIVSQSSSEIEDGEESNQIKSHELSLSYSGNMTDSSTLFNMIIFNLKMKYLEFKSTIKEQRFYDEFVRMIISGMLYIFICYFYYFFIYYYVIFSCCFIESSCFYDNYSNV